MGKIRRDFLRGELRRLALCAAGFGLCLLVLLRCWSGGKERLPLLLAGIGAVLGPGSYTPLRAPETLLEIACRLLV